MKITLKIAGSVFLLAQLPIIGIGYIVGWVYGGLYSGFEHSGNHLVKLHDFLVTK